MLPVALLFSKQVFYPISKVRPKPASQDEYLKELVDLLTHKYAGKSGIVYTTTIKDTEQTCNNLRCACVFLLKIS